MSDKPNDFDYKFLIGIVDMGSQGGVFEFKYQLSYKEYLNVREQILQKQTRISFIEMDTGEPMCFPLSHPTVYVKTEKTEKPKHIIAPYSKQEQIGIQN